MAPEPRDEWDLDDWFAEPEPLPEEWSLGSHEHGEAELEDWLHEPEHSPRKLTRLPGKRRVESAVGRFQAASGLTPDGILGPLTRRALTRALAP